MNQSIRDHRTHTHTHREGRGVDLCGSSPAQAQPQAHNCRNYQSGVCWVVVVWWLWKQIQPMGFSACVPASQFRQQLSLSICENQTLLRPSNLFLSSVGGWHEPETSKSSTIYTVLLFCQEDILGFLVVGHTLHSQTPFCLGRIQSEWTKREASTSTVV